MRKRGEADTVIEKNNTEDKEEQYASPKKPENVKPGKKHEQDEPGKSKKKSGDSVERKRQTTEQMKNKWKRRQHKEFTLSETWGLCQRSEESFGMQIPTASIIIPGMFINLHLSHL